MDTEKYRALLCVLDTGSLTAAAETLGYTTSGLSRMMVSLEEDLQLQLLLRGKNGVTPTAGCKEILPIMREVVFEQQKLEQKVAQWNGADIGTVIIGSAYSAYYSILGKLISDFSKLAPNISVQICPGQSSKLLQDLEHHKIDMCIISYREEISDWMLLCDDPVVAMVPVSHPLAEGVSFPIKAFETENFIQSFPGHDVDNNRVLSKYGINPNVQYTTLDSMATCALVEAGLGVSMNNKINTFPCGEDVKIMELDPFVSIPIGIAYSKDMSPAAHRFAEFLKENIEILKK